MNNGETAWYCARTKVKQEHIAAANLWKNLDLRVFHPRLQVVRATQRGKVRVVEPLFPGYVFVHCVLDEMESEIQRTMGITGLLRFGTLVPRVPDKVIEELQECFQSMNPMLVESRLSPGDEVKVAGGVFGGVSAFVLRVMPARNRVQVLMDILGRPTPVELDDHAVILERNTLADLAPALAAPDRNQMVGCI